MVKFLNLIKIVFTISLGLIVIPGVMIAFDISNNFTFFAPMVGVAGIICCVPLVLQHMFYEFILERDFPEK